MWIYNLGEQFKYISNLYSEKTALIIEDTKITYKELDLSSNKFANFLIKQSIQKQSLF